ncbi:MAG: pitrilysin family protein [Steroidobacteraceae bacterium]
MYRKYGFALLVVLGLQAVVLPTAMSAELKGRDQITSVTLSNGMQVIVWPDHDIPSVALYNFVKVGSRNEVVGKTGLAHFFEHMMFNGTAKRAQGEFDRVMESAGGSNNAYTSEDVTVYQDWFPRSALETIFELEADRLQNLAFVPEVVESERGVVYSERRLRVEDDNEAKLAEQVQATAFLAHPYGVPVIGWPSDIQGWQLADLKDFFKTHYAPNNCTLVLVGDVEPTAILALARKYLEPIPAQVPAEALRTREPQQEGERRVSLQLPAQTPLLQFAYHSPEITSADMPALELLLRILSDGESSRLYQALVERDKLAIAVTGDVMRSFDPGLLWFYLSLPADADVDAAEHGFDAELQRLLDNGVTAQELDKARNIVLSEFWQQLSTINGKASALGRYAVFHHDYQKLFTMPDVYARVTQRDLQQLAQTLLRKGNRTVGVVTPAAEDEADDSAEANAEESK